MDKFYEVINKIIEDFQGVKLNIVNDEKIILFKNRKYKIIIEILQKEEILINKKWETGLIGKLFFRKEFKDFERLSNKINKFFTKEGYTVNFFKEIKI